MVLLCSSFAADLGLHLLTQWQCSPSFYERLPTRGWHSLSLALYQPLPHPDGIEWEGSAGLFS